MLDIKKRHLSVPTDHSKFYCGELVKRFGGSATEGEKPHVSCEFSAMNARTLDKVLAAIGY